ncbi:MAG: hypothetical protein K0S29_413 [Gammaproteobacteria bacterium]|jgi:hypothetical protein|nr:hypothetical protein [Gammaproteobacteria bacterium]
MYHSLALVSRRFRNSYPALNTQNAFENLILRPGLGDHLASFLILSDISRLSKTSGLMHYRIIKPRSEASDMILATIAGQKSVDDMMQAISSDRQYYSNLKSLPVSAVRMLLSHYSIEDMDRLVMANLTWIPVADEIIRKKLLSLFDSYKRGALKEAYTDTLLYGIFLLLFILFPLLCLKHSSYKFGGGVGLFVSILMTAPAMFLTLYVKCLSSLSCLSVPMLENLLADGHLPQFNEIDFAIENSDSARPVLYIENKKAASMHQALLASVSYLPLVLAELAINKVVPLENIYPALFLFLVSACSISSLVKMGFNAGTSHYTPHVKAFMIKARAQGIQGELSLARLDRIANPWRNAMQTRALEFSQQARGASVLQEP